MLQPRIASPLRRALFDRCCVWIHGEFRNTGRSLAFPASIRTFTPSSIVKLPEDDSQSSEKDDDVFVPKPLGRPIGFKTAPEAIDNAESTISKKDYSGMTLKERNLEKRKDLVEKWGTSYFRDFKNIRKYRSGKTFIANPRIFKKDVALYFPNFRGDTLAEQGTDTTPVLQDKVSIVNVYSSQWGEAQVRTFTGASENPELHKIISQHPNIAQIVDINIEENSLKALIIALFKWRLRATRSKEDWGKYFVIKRGVSVKVRETIGLLNGRVGYVYLVDQECKIRWAGSANAEGTEIEDLNKGFAKLAAEA